MKKMSRWVKVILSTFLAVVLLFVLFFGRTLYGLAQSNPLATSALTENVYVVQTGTANFYLIRGNSGYIAVDAGSSKEQASHELNTLGISPDDVFAVFLTHSDIDHIAAISLYPNATLYLSELELPLIEGTAQRASGRLLFIFSLFSVLNLNDDNPIFPHDFTIINHNEKMEIDGLLIQSFLTPGHMSGSMCFLVDDKYLFTGDTMSIINGRAGRFFHLFDMDNDQAKESISKIATVPAQYIFTSHHGYSDNLDFVFENWD